MTDYPNAAGIVVFKIIDDEYHLLVLHGLDGRLDIPKGVCDPGEDTFTAALRETEEEAGLTDLHFPLDHINERFDSLYVYVAITEQEVTIVPNPKSESSSILDMNGWTSNLQKMQTGVLI